VDNLIAARRKRCARLVAPPGAARDICSRNDRAHRVRRLLRRWTFPEESLVPHALEHNHRLSRREFSRESVLAMLAGVVITVTGCSEDSSSPTTPTGGSGTDVTGTVSANHGHVATVRAVDITAAGAVSLDIRGQADHPHTVMLTATQVQQIGNRQQLTATSTTDAGHQHTVTFN
jgi:hypothetical protein